MEIKNVKINTAVRDMLEQKYNFERSQAEGIAIAIESTIAFQDTSELATKKDITESKSELIKTMSDMHISTIKWVAGLLIAQTALILGFAGKLTGKW